MDGNHVVVSFDVAKILAARGLEPNGAAQTFMTNECAKQMDAYIPMQQGILKNTRIIGEDSITYNAPYARFHYFGKVMIGVNSRSPWARRGERKEVTDRDLKHHGAPKRGPFWDKRMWAEKGDAITRGVVAIVGGKTK